MDRGRRLIIHDRPLSTLWMSDLFFFHVLFDFFFLCVVARLFPLLVRPVSHHRVRVSSFSFFLILMIEQIPARLSVRLMRHQRPEVIGGGWGRSARCY